MKAWYFSANDKKLRFGDNRTIKAGITHKVKGEPKLCEYGLHGSQSILDALSYAPGSYVWRVELGGTMDRSNDKITATERHYLWGYDAKNVLHKFARLCALDVIHLWDAPDIVVKYLKTGDESIRASAGAAAWAVARAAARDAARDAAWDAARAAAWDASWDAAWAVAWGAARDAARDAAWAVAWDAAWAVAREKQNKRLYKMIINNRYK